MHDDAVVEAGHRDLARRRRVQFCAQYPLHRTSLSAMPDCGYCGAYKPTRQGLVSHQRQSAECRALRREYIAQRAPKAHPAAVDEFNELSDAPVDDQQDVPADATHPRVAPMGPPPAEPAQLIYDSPGTLQEPVLSDSTPEKKRGAWFEEVEDEDRFPVKFPAEQCAGQPSRPGLFMSIFEQMQARALENGEIWGPFATQDEWELSQWLFENVGYAKIDEFLKLNFVSTAFCHDLSLFAPALCFRVLSTVFIHNCIRLSSIPRRLLSIIVARYAKRSTTYRADHSGSFASSQSKETLPMKMARGELRFSSSGCATLSSVSVSCLVIPTFVM
jgi:hypothetical protein